MDKKYKVETHFGCTSNAIIVNGKSYYGEDQRYTMSDEERSEFDGALLKEIRRRFSDGEIGPNELLSLLHYDNYECSPTCEQCGDSVQSTYYTF